MFFFSPALSASMGPWLCSHGKVFPLSSTRSRTRLQWGRGCVATESSWIVVPSTLDTASFNGAVAV